MQNFNRYLIFYIILAVGLVIAWSQVGHRAELRQEAGLSLMQTEQDCRPRKAPCAAYAGHFALLVGPVPQGPALLVVAEKLPPGAALEVIQLDRQAHTLEAPLLRPQGEGRWILQVASEAVQLRLTVAAEGRRWLAEYPL